MGGTCLPVGVSHRPQCAALLKPGRATQDRLGRAMSRPSSPMHSNQIVEVRRHALKNPGGLGAGPQVTREPNTKNPKKPSSNPLLRSFTICFMNIHPITTPASPSLASPHFDASCDSIESLTTSFTASALPTLETTTVTEVALGYHRNQQYSITAMTTSTGAVAERYAYTAYGQPTICNATGSPIGNQQSQIANRFTYTGREWDETLGLHHFRARWMSPLAGRFLGRDPIGYEDGWNLPASYLSLHRVDPSGQGCIIYLNCSLQVRLASTGIP